MVLLLYSSETYISLRASWYTLCYLMYLISLSLEVWKILDGLEFWNQMSEMSGKVWNIWKTGMEWLVCWWALDHCNTTMLPLCTTSVKRDVRSMIPYVYQFFLDIMLGRLLGQSIEEQVTWCAGLVNFLLQSPTTLQWTVRVDFHVFLALLVVQRHTSLLINCSSVLCIIGSCLPIWRSFCHFA